MPSSSRRRPNQVGEIIRQVIAETLLHEVRDPRIALVTVTRVIVSPDLSHARVSVFMHGDDDERDRALEGLESAAGFLRSRVAKVLATRTTPDLEFELDRGLDHAAEMNKLFADLRRGSEPSDTESREADT